MDTMIAEKQQTTKAIVMVQFTLSPVCLGVEEPVYRDFGKGTVDIRDAREHAKPFNGVAFSSVELGTVALMHRYGQTYCWFDADKAFEAAVEPLEALALPDWDFWSNVYNQYETQEEFFLDEAGCYRSKNIQNMVDTFGGPGFFWDGRQLVPCLGVNE